MTDKEKLIIEKTDISTIKFGRNSSSTVSYKNSEMPIIEARNYLINDLMLLANEKNISFNYPTNHNDCS